MKKTTLVLALTACAAYSASPVFANGLAEDRAWQFQSSSAKFVRLQQRMAEELLDAGGPGPGNTTITLGDGSTLVIGDAVAGDKQQSDTSNCLNCSNITTAVEVGDTFSGTLAVGQQTVTQQAAGNNDQTNGTRVESNAGTVQSAIGQQNN